MTTRNKIAEIEAIMEAWAHREESNIETLHRINEILWVKTTKEKS